jgi:hypothetical protein
LLKGTAKAVEPLVIRPERASLGEIDSVKKQCIRLESPKLDLRNPKEIRDQKPERRNRALPTRFLGKESLDG